MKTIAVLLILLSTGISLPFTIGQKDNKSVQVIPDMKIPADPAENILYVPTFRASWTMLKLDIVKNDIRLKEPVPMVPYLNNNPYAAKNDACWMAMAGFVESGIIGKIDAELKARFEAGPSGLGKYARERDGIICYSRFRKSIHFEVPFEKLTWKFNTGATSISLACFGITRHGGSEKEQMRKQASIHDYRNPDDFILIFSGKDPGQELILAKTGSIGSMEEMFRVISDRISQTPTEEITELDELIIPKIKLSVNHNYHELIGKYLANRKFRDYFFAEAGQDISLFLDESGATAEATGTIVKMKGPAARIYAFDKPFLLILRGKGAVEPDLVLWIANTNFLVPSA